MKVLYMTNLPAPYRMLFFEELGKLCELTVLFETEKAVDRNAKWFPKPYASSFRYTVLPGILCGKDSAFNPSVLRWLNRSRYDVIVVSGYSSPTEILAILYMKLKRLPFVASTDGGFITKGESRLKRKFKKLLIGAAQYWMASGKGAQEYLEFYGADPARTYLYPFTSLREEDILPRPIKVNEKESWKRKLGVDGMLVLSVGRFIPSKGYDVLLKGWKRIKSRGASLAIIGGGPEKAAYLKLVEELGLENVMILDFMQKDELQSWYKAADAFVFPTRYDSWGLVVNEAMAKGLPVITTDAALAGLELVEDGRNGCVVPADEVDIMAECIDNVLSDSTWRQNMAAASLEIIRPYTIANMAHTYAEVFKGILKSYG